MNARIKTYMLVPEFSYPPGQRIALGTVLSLSDATKLPDIDDPLEICVPVAEDRITQQLQRPFEWNSDDATTTAAGATADLSFFTGVGAGAKGEHHTSVGLKISSELVTKTWFKPTPQELTKFLSDPAVFETLQERSRPPLYLVTGLMVAGGATIEDRAGKRRGGGAHANADLTALQAPLNLGVEGERSRTTNTSGRTTIEGEFILAYKLLRFKKRFFGKVEQKTETKWALFHDTVPTEGAVTLDEYLDDDDLEDILVGGDGI
jgi:hypothetical protein